MLSFKWRSIELFGMLFILFFGAYGTQVAWATIYWVDVQNQVASDGNSGTEDRPFKSISYAAKKAVSGDTVLVKNGIYREFIEVAHSGESADRRIEFRAEGDKVVLKGSDEVFGWALQKGYIWKKENWQINSQQVFVDGNVLEQIGGNPLFSPDRLPSKGSGLDSMIPGSFFYDAKNKTLYVWLKDNGDPRKHHVEASVRPLIFLVKWKNYIKLQGFNFQHSNNTATIKSGWPAVAINGNGCVVENNNITWCDFAGLGGNGNNIIIKNNNVSYNGNSGISFSGSNIIMDGNVTNYNNYRNFKADWHAGGMKNTIISKSVVRNHTAQHNNGSGIWFDIDCVDNVIESSRVQHNKDMGIFYEISKAGLIRNNIVSDNATHGIYISASSDCNVLNNTVYANMRGIVVHGVPRSSLGKKYTLFNNVVANNIIAANTNADLVMARPSADAGGNSSDYNLFYQRSGALNNRLDYAGVQTSLAQWQKSTGHDMHSLVADPRFMDQSKNDYRLRAGSPAKGAGKVTVFVKDDLNATPRGNRNDIGPFWLGN